MSFASFSLQMRPESALLQIRLALRGTIRAVRINIPAGVAFIEKLFKHIAVVNGGIRNFVIPNDFVIDIRLNMVLVAVVILPILLNPAGIRVLLPLLRVAPIFNRWISFFDRLVFIAGVTLRGNANDGRIDNLPLLRHKSGLGKKCIELVKQLPYELMLLQFRTEEPDREHGCQVPYPENA